MRSTDAPHQWVSSTLVTGYGKEGGQQHSKPRSGAASHPPARHVRQKVGCQESSDHVDGSAAPRVV